MIFDLPQAKVTTLTKLKDKCKSPSTRGSVTIDEIKLGIACTRPVKAATAHLFCIAMGYLAYRGESTGCDKIVSANGIPHILDLLSRLPEDEDAASQACWALHCLAGHGSETIKTILRSQANIASLLRSASPRLLAWDCEDDWASSALKKLGISMVA